MKNGDREYAIIIFFQDQNYHQMKMRVQNGQKQAALKTMSTELWNSLSQSFFGVMVLVGMIHFLYRGLYDAVCWDF